MGVEGLQIKKRESVGGEREMKTRSETCGEEKLVMK